LVGALLNSEVIVDGSGECLGGEFHKLVTEAEPTIAAIEYNPSRFVQRIVHNGI